MEVTVEHLGALQFEIKARQHAIVSDQPPENGGHDEGMTPPELLLASLDRAPVFTRRNTCGSTSWPAKARASGSPPKTEGSRAPRQLSY